MIKLRDTFTLKPQGGVLGVMGLAKYKPYINYSWSSTYQSNNQMYSTNSGTGTDLQLYSGQGVKFNGVDQSVPIDNTSADYGSYIFRLNKTLARSFYVMGDNASYISFIGVSSTSVEFRSGYGDIIALPCELGINKNHDICLDVTSNDITLFVNNKFISSKPNTANMSGAFNAVGKTENDNSNGTIKDLLKFNDNLTPQEIALYSSNPNQFFNNVRDGIIDNCVLNMPMDGNGSEIKDYQNNTTYSIQNYTDSCRDEAKQLPYGSQNVNYTINGLGIRTEESPYFEADGIGKAIIPNHTDNVNISLVVNPTELNGNILSGGLTLDTTGLTVEADNTINLTNQTPTGDITLADGFKGTIKSYKEELV